MPKKASADGDWAGVDKAIHNQLKRLNWSQADLSRRSGVDEKTIGTIKQPKDRNMSTLVALSAALGCRGDYLFDVLLGKIDPDEPPPSPAETALFENLRTEFNSLRMEVATLSDGIREVNRKVTAILDRQQGE